MAEKEQRVAGWLARVTSAFVLLAWAAFAALAFTKMPRGYAFFSLRFVLHDTLPMVIAVACVAGVGALRRPCIARGVLEGLAALSLAAATGSALRFPESRALLPLAFAAIGVATLIGSAALRRSRVPLAARAAALVIGAVLGVAIPEALRAPDPSTRPAGESITLPVDRRMEPALLAPAGVLRIEEPGLSLEIDPFLTVESRSPDRSWTVLAPPTTRHATVWRPHARAVVGDATRTWWRSDDGVGVVTWTPGEPTTLDSAFRLDAPIYTHLATWSVIRLAAPETRARFSPCGDDEIEIRPSDYPEGRPVRFAYLAPHDRFVVAEATSGEKGPFRTLCEGRLERDDELTLTLLYRRGSVEITLLDFAAQASTEPSPTAGWGVPQNAIELMREGSSPSGAVIVHVTLAATGIGRGWDTVGLVAGTYRNRMRVGLRRAH